MNRDRRSSLRRMGDIAWSRAQWLRGSSFTLPACDRSKLLARAVRLEAFGNRCFKAVWDHDNDNIQKRPTR